jgi:hypothetical protein
MYFRSSTSMRFSGQIIDGALDSLKMGLAGSAGMAGSDNTGHEFSGGYDQVAQDIAAGLAGLTAMSTNTADLIRASGLNHQAAQRASTQGGTPPASVPIPDTPIKPAPTIPSAYGGGGSEPTGAIATAWHYVQQWVGYVWPNGSPERLGAAAQSWTAAFNHIKSADTSIEWATNDLASQQSPEIPTATAHLNELKGKVDGLAKSCLQMATSCNNLAQAIKDAHDQLIDELSQFAAEFVVGEIVFGVLFEVGGELWGNAAMVARAMNIAQRCARIIEKLIDLARSAARVARAAGETIKNVVSKIKSVVAAITKRAPAGLSSSMAEQASAIGKEISGFPKGTRAAAVAERMSGLHLTQAEAAEATDIASKAAFGETTGIANLPNGTKVVLPAYLPAGKALMVHPDGTVTVFVGDCLQFLEYIPK